MVCKIILKTGKRKGQECGAKTKPGETRCGRHKVAVEKKECKSTHILNPKTNRCVTKTGVIGKKLIGDKKEVVPKKPRKKDKEIFYILMLLQLGMFIPRKALIKMLKRNLGPNWFPKVCDAIDQLSNKPKMIMQTLTWYSNTSPQDWIGNCEIVFERIYG